MKKSKVLSFALGMCVLFALAGCAPTTYVDPTPTWGPTPTPTPVLPACDGAALVAPVGSAPAQFSVTSLTPTLTWSYPDPTCLPTGYNLHFAMGPLYTPELGGSLGLATSYTPGTPLQPGKVYEWKVSAVSGGSVGPESSRRVFFTGPQCDSAGMSAPVLFEYEDWATINTLSPFLKWDSVGGCIPEGYRLQIATDAAFTSILESDDFPIPLNRAIAGDPGPFTDCTRYYWRVAQLVGGAAGPFSEVWTFRIDLTGACAPEPPASVSGVVWNDNNEDSVRQVAESGRPGVVVNIGAGDCPAFSFIQQATTAADGSYSFTGLLPGKYCMEIDPLADISIGHFTLGASGKEGRAYAAISVGPGAALTGQDFGWYQIPPAVPQITLKINAYCRIGPGPLFNAPEFGIAGQSYPILGISPDLLWYYVKFSETRNCWFAKDSGDTSGNLDTLPPGPTPVPTAVVDCSKYSSQPSCEAVSACKWYNPGVRAPYCTNK